MKIIIIFIVLLISISVLDLSSNKNKAFAKIAYYVALVCVAILAICVGKYIKEIPAIEVYRGNTVLQITYQDSVPIDSVVVYKNK